MTRRLATRLTTNPVLVLVLVLSVASCTRGESPATEADPPRTTAAGQAATPTSSVTDLYDVGGHKLYMSCTGEGDVTVVQVHGWVNDPGFVPHEHMAGVVDRLDERFRVCLYDRRNVGSSDTVDAVQTPDDVVRDMERVLRAGKVEPPYILMAGSFGGLVAHAYLAKHPDNVVGMVLVDAMWPDELKLDKYLPRRYRFQYFDKDDTCCTLERISQFDLIRSLQRTIGKEPPIPAVYLASQQEPRDQNDYESPAYDARVLESQATYVDRFSPGILHWVDAPHWMEPVVPDTVADAVFEVAELAGR